MCFDRPDLCYIINCDWSNRVQWPGLCHGPTLGSKRPGLIPSNPHGLRMGKRKEPRNSDILLPQKGVNRLQAVEYYRCLPHPQYNKIESLTNTEK